MKTRYDLHDELVRILSEALNIRQKDARARVFFIKPPSTVNPQYPRIVYSLPQIKTKSADNKVYQKSAQYQITVIDQNPDTKIPEELVEQLNCAFVTSYTADNLCHFIYSITI